MHPILPTGKAEDADPAPDWWGNPNVHHGEVNDIKEGGKAEVTNPPKPPKKGVK